MAIGELKGWGENTRKTDNLSSKNQVANPNHCLVVSVDFGNTTFGVKDFEEMTEECRQLSLSAGLSVAEVVIVKRSVPDAKFFIGSGKVDEISQLAKAHEASVVVFNHDLSPSQQRNLERVLECSVTDRTGLILEIFAQRAKTHEGKLQVELAQMAHLATRLVRGWTHLERQAGGIGMRGGPGEKQIELDRRLINVRVKQLRDKLEKLKAQRGQQRRSRQRSQVLSASLVGYTNAGKSTLFNKLSPSKVFAADQLFATLDTTSRSIYIEEAGSVVLSDTVGFIKHLPHALVEAFGATLEEAAQADVLLHVVDCASSNRDSQVAEVEKVLKEIGAADVPQILVLNQIDRAGLEAGLERDEYGRICKVRVSAKTGDGLQYLKQALVERAAIMNQHMTEENYYI